MITRVLISLIFLLPLSALLSQEDAIVATWWNADKTSHIRIFKATNGKYYGKIEWLETEPERKDVNNPDPSKQDEPLIGLMILKGFSWDGDKQQWTGGTVYDPENGKTYDCYMWFEDDPDELHIKGYVMGMKFVGRETAWEKVK